MTKRLALAGASVVACLAAASGGIAAPQPIGVAPQPTQPRVVAVPAAVVAAHPNGQAGGLTAVPVTASAGGATINATERISCWRAYFTYDHSPGIGTEAEWINPYWCGNGSAMRAIDTSWHGQTCTILVSCNGESGIGNWYGCGYGCSSIGQQINGYFTVWLGVSVNATLTVLYELYPNGNYWSYYYSS